MAASSSLLLWPVGCRWVLCLWAAAHSFCREKKILRHIRRSGDPGREPRRKAKWISGANDRTFAGPTGVTVTMACAWRCGLLLENFIRDALWSSFACVGDGRLPSDLPASLPKTLQFVEDSEVEQVGLEDASLGFREDLQHDSHFMTLNLWIMTLSG
ncbi:uncharacterized protein J3D65DRAFT_601533 [Phyllosticta citribraziliensis]|uniref:Secreted protein n=1 Tax=Phyllosticta citribraziliensis TaxID=989973 RepID=A0ABR1LWA9_9PEZI